MTGIAADSQARQARRPKKRGPLAPATYPQEASTVDVSPETRSDRQEVVPMMNGYAMSGWGWLLMTLGMLGFWALVAVLALALLRRPGQPDQRPRLGAEEILAARL